MGTAAGADRPPGGGEPVLQLEAGGPTAAITALAFSPDGQTLYAAGFDKVVRAWLRQGERFRPGPVYRVPIGPGAAGAVNALAVSPDGRWLAAAGKGVVREAAGFRDVGLVVPRAGRLSDEQRADEGVVHLFSTTDRRVRVLRGHKGPVLALAFAPARAAAPAVLVSVAREGDDDSAAGAAILWDAERGVPLARTAGLPDPGNNRVGVAAWPVGPGAADLRVALAVPGAALHVWDPAEERPRPVGEAAPFADSAVFVPAAGAGVLLTASFRAGDAHLQGWRAGRTVAADPKRAGAAATGCAPRALAVAPGRPDLAAVVLRFPDPGRDPSREEYRLRLVRLAPGRTFAARRADVSLWRGGSLPALALSADGRTLAVAGNRDHEIYLFTVGERLALRQRLHSEGVDFDRAAFVRRGTDAGLLLESADTKLVLDLANRRLSDAADDWKPDAPAADGWTVAGPEPDDRGRAVFTVRGGDVDGTVRLAAGQRPTAWALLPPRPPLKVPLLAVGYEERGVTALALYDAAAGRQVRQYTGHLNPIHSLAFSGDGRLLVSAAADQTVSVWSLADLPGVVGRRGRLLGLALEKRGAALRIVRLDTDELSAENRKALDRAGVRVGDVLEKVAGAAAPRPPATPHEFYEALWRTAPGAVVTLTLAGRGDVPVRVDQGVDDHKPLFSLFVTRGAAAAERRWIGWSPAGPYDAAGSGDPERAIGWHRNTGRPEAPVSFSLADQYRDEYRREGILRHLVARAALAPALQDWRRDAPAPRPRTSLEIDGPALATIGDAGTPLVRARAATVRAAVQDIPLDKVRRVELTFNGVPVLSAAEPAEREFTADLSGAAWKRGGNELRLVVTTQERQPRDHARSLPVVYLPPAPRIVLGRVPPAPGAAAGAAAVPALRTTLGARGPVRFDVTQPDFALDAAVVPGGGAAVRVRLRHGDSDEAVAGTRIERQLRLRPGENVVEIVADNDGLLPEWRDYETAARRLVIHYTPEKVVPPPVVALDSVTPAGGAALAPPREGEALVVHARRITVRGRVRAAEALTAAALDGRPLAGFTAGRPALQFEEVVALQPGVQELTFHARTARSVAQPRFLLVDYQPDLPRVEAVSPSGRRRPGEPLEARLQVRLTRPADPYPFTARVRVNGTEVPAAVGDNDMTLTAPLRLRPGENRVAIALANDRWERPAEDVVIYVPRPPRVVGADRPAVGAAALADVTFRVESPADLPLTGARLGERELPPDSLKKGEAANGVQTWTVVARGVSLNEGKNELALWARNGDGESLEPGSIVVTYTRPPPPVAQVEIVEPAGDLRVAEPRCRLVVRVRSASAVRRLEVLRDGRPLEVELPAPAAEPGNVRRYELAALPLKPGTNVLEVEVVNDGGAARSGPRTVSYTRRTVLVRLERLEDREQPGRFFEPTAEVRGRPVFECVPVADVRLHGTVEWPDAAVAGLRDPAPVRVWVNDFEQLGGALDEPAPGALRRTFRLDLRLNRAEDNRVQLEFPTLKLEAGERPELVVDCSRPVTGKRLHLLVVGPGQRDQRALTDAVLEALHARKEAGAADRFTAPPDFREGRVYGPLPADVDPEQVDAALLRIKQTIRATPGPLNDVVIVFFQGQEVNGPAGHFLLTEQSRRPGTPLAETAIDCAALRGTLDGVQGAKLLLLDVVRSRASGGGLVNGPSGAPRVGMLRLVWLGDEESPENARLVAVLQALLARGGRMVELREQMLAWARREYPRSVAVQWDGPDGLAHLALGRVP